MVIRQKRMLMDAETQRWRWGKPLGDWNRK
jgi:hypothetical protein